MENKKFKKYAINSKVLISNIILSAVFLIIFIVFLILTNSELVSSMSTKMYNTLVILKEASLVGVTLFVGAIISSCLLERTNRNNEYFSDILNAVVCDSKVFETLDEKNRKYLKTHLFGFEHLSQIDMVESVISKLKEFDYYYDECNFEVSCEINKETCKKHFSKTLKIKSFSDSFEIPHFRLYSSDTKETNDNFLVFKMISIDNRTLVEGTDYFIRKEVIKSEERMARNQSHKDYKNRFICELIHPLKVSSSHPVNIRLAYETNVTNDDCFINRLPGPCKKYHLSFGVSSAKNDQYDINGSAFGFMDRGDRIPNIGDNRVVFDFDSWSFKDDGVSLNYKKKRK